MFGQLRIWSIVEECMSVEIEEKGVFYGRVKDKERRYKMSDSVGREVAPPSATYTVFFSSFP